MILTHLHLYSTLVPMKYETLTQKKEKIDSFRPLPKELVKNLTEWFRVELTYTSNALEGNTLTSLETALVIEKGIAIGGRSLQEHLEATNHAKAFDWIVNFVNHDPLQITEKDIVHIHEMLARNIRDGDVGRYREAKINVAGVPGLHKVSDLMIHFVEALNRNRLRLHPIEKAAFAYYTLMTIHPFSAENDRTARLLMNLVLLRYGYPVAVIASKDYLNVWEKAPTTESMQGYMNLIMKAVDHSLDIYLNALDIEST